MIEHYKIGHYQLIKKIALTKKPLIISTGMSDIEEIAGLCQDKGVTLIEDCAHSFGATLNNMPSGLFGDAGVYSFYTFCVVFLC